MMGLVVSSSLADQGGPQDWAKELLLSAPTLIESLTAVNKGDACFIQLFDTPRKVGAIAISDTEDETGGTPGLITCADLTGTGYVTGDKVTFDSITGLTTHYIAVVSSTTIKCYSTRALALAGGDPDVFPTDDDDTGSFMLASDAASTPVYEVYPLAALANAPANVLSLTLARFKRGVYVRAVTTINGSTLISATDVKFTPRYRNGDIVELNTYRD